MFFRNKNTNGSLFIFFFFKLTFYIPDIMNLINQQWTGKATIANPWHNFCVPPLTWKTCYQAPGVTQYFALLRSLYSKVIYFLLAESMSWHWIELSVRISVRKMYTFISDFFNYITSCLNLQELNGSLIASVLLNRNLIMCGLYC